MSTRACIRIKERISEGSSKKDCEIILYHHHDGYPSGVGSDLKRYIAEEVSTWTFWNPEAIATDLVRGIIKDSDGEPDLSYEVAICEHGDCEYGYVIDCDAKTLKCYELDAGVQPWREENIVPIPDKEA